MTSSFRTFSLLLGLCAITTGCATAPPEVKADVPLVPPYLLSGGQLATETATSVPAATLSSLSASQPTEIALAGSRYMISGHYRSALGNECRKLRLQRDNNIDAHTYRAICKRNGEWQLLNPLVSAVDEKDL